MVELTLFLICFLSSLAQANNNLKSKCNYKTVGINKENAGGSLFGLVV